jgi:phospholipid-binding lipoprotein MlaA
MSLRKGAILGCALLLALAACSRRLPSPAPDSEAEAPAIAEAAAPPVELAGGPPASDATPAASSAEPDAPIPPTPAPDGGPAPTADATAVPGRSPDGPAPPLAGGPAEARPDDPLEPMNRRFYVVDRTVGQAIIRRVRILDAAPPHSHAALEAARNLLNNLDEPTTAANDLLQRKFGRALKSAVRFVINSTVGLAGIRDVASRMGLKRRPNTLDRTLASYGAPAGPYLYLPIAGPTTLRAAVGALAQSYFYPPNWLHLAAGVDLALRGAGYAKLANSALSRAKTLPPVEPGHDGYVRTRKAYLSAHAAQKTSYAELPGKPSATALAANDEPLD